MPFNLVHISQQDPRWKNIKLGNSKTSTIGAYGCAMTSVAMYLSGFGYPETSQTLNEKLKQRGGYVNDAIIWGAVSGIYPKVRFKNLIICRDTDAPIDLIGNSIAAGQPVLLEVDSSPKSGLQTHWVVAYKKVGKDFLILDPWPYPTEQGKEVSLVARYSHGKLLKNSITAVVLYECVQSGDGTSVVPSTPPADGSLHVRVTDEAVSGLRVRSAPTTNSNTLSLEYPGTFLKVVEAEATALPKIGVYDQWLRIRNPAGTEGYVAAWFVENATSTTPVPPVEPPADTTPPDETGTPPADTVPPEVKRVRPSVGDGLENVPTPAPQNQRLTASASQSGTFRLVADIWNRYGGLLAALSNKLGIEPGAAVSVLAIESGGQAFGPDGRLLIRFENHLFYNYWGKQNVEKFNKHFTFDLSQRWMGHKWRSDPKGAWVDFHGNQTKEWQVFEFARDLDETAAMMSISMGAPQIMGFNYTIIGYASVQDMFTAFSRSDRDHVIGFFDFVQGVLPNNGAIRHLQRKDFTSFATVYNGSGQAAYYGNLMKTGYDAFNKLYSALPPLPPPTPDPDPVPVDVPPSEPPAPLPDPQPQPDPQPEPQPDPKPAPVSPPKDKIFVLVSKSVGSGGLRMRKKPSQLGELIVVQPAGTSLRLSDPAERPMIGKQGSWLKVNDRQGREGYVAAWMVEFDPKKSEINSAGVSFDVASFTAEPEPLVVHVSALAGRGGLRLREAPTSSGKALKSLLVGTPLEVLEDALAAEPKVGRYGEWLKVQEPLGAQGYVAAWFIEE